MIHHHPRHQLIRSPWLAVLAFLALCALPLAVNAQAATATLSGTVEDQNKGLVPGAKVKVINLSTGLERDAVTNDSGAFTIPLLPPSSYTVRVQRDGFVTIEVSNIVLNVGDDRSLLIQMKVGDVKEVVNVTGQEPLINESPAVGTVVDRTQVENMPLNGRSFQSLITLTPGVVLTPNLAQNPGQFSVNGQRTYSNYFTVDGVSANTGVSISSANNAGLAGAQPSLTAQGGTQGLVSVDALQEFRIQTSTYAPEFGRSPGGQIQLATRSGANEFHGSVFDYVRNDVFDANDWFANATRQPKPKERQNDFGATFSGPVILPRFGEGGRQPGYSGKNKSFFFFTYEGLRLRQPQFSIQFVPSLSTRQATAAAFQPFINAYPLPNGPDSLNAAGQPTGLAQFADGHSDPSSLDAAGIRLDHAFNSRMSIFGRFSNTPSQLATRTAGTNQISTTIGNTRTVTVGSVISFTTNTINDLRFNYTRSLASATRTTDNYGGAVPVPESAVALPSSQSLNSAGFTFSLIGFSGVVVPGVGLGTGGTRNLQRQINLVDSLIHTLRSHELKFGVDYRRTFPVVGYSAYSESVIVSGLTALRNGTATIGSISSFPTNIKPVFVNLSLFGQDTWRVNKRFTLTYGLRWEFDPVPHNSNGADPSALIGLNSPATFALAPNGTPIYPTRYNDFAPRFGAAYHVIQKQKFETIIRAGYGLFYDLGSTEATTGFLAFPNVAQKSLSSVPYPFTAAQLTPPVIGLTPPYNGTFSVYGPGFNLPYVTQWSLAVEQSLGPNQTLTASYVGSKGRRLLRQQLYQKPNANFSSTVAVYREDAASDYDALQVEFQRRLSRGFQVLAAYTWGHALDDLSTDAGTSGSQASRGNSSFDVRHNFALSASYLTPKFSASRPLQMILGHWGFDAIIHAQSALPVDVSIASITVGTETFFRRPDVIAGVPFYVNDPTVAGGRRFNNSAFVTPPAGRQGSLGRNVLRALPLSQVDFAVRRRFALTERLALHARVEAFNLFNHPNFGNVNTSAGTATFGVPSSMAGRALGGLSPIYQIGGPRSFQFELRLAF